MELRAELGAVTQPDGRRRVTILGSTGSVGCSTVALIEGAAEAFEVEALTANRNVELLATQARGLRARLAVVADDTCYGALKEALAGSGIEVAGGASGLIEAAARPSDLVMAGIVGFAGLPPILAAARRGATIALANKEALVCAGSVLLRALTSGRSRLLPVDSEHSAIFQCLEERNRDAVERLILTASGGPFRDWTAEQMALVRPAQAVAHPRWNMGAKISVDSATMMNKGLELIEAHHLFAMPADRVEIVVHPQSVIHSMVAYKDGSVIAQLGDQDMRVPIAYALAWPRRMKTAVRPLDFSRLCALTFEPPDEGRFPALKLAREALRIGGIAPISLNAANEVAVGAFLASGLRFLDIVPIVEEAMTQMVGSTGVGSVPSDFNEIREVDEEARGIAHGLCSRQALQA